MKKKSAHSPKSKIDSRARRERLAEIERRWLSGNTEGSIREWLRQTYGIKTNTCKILLSKVKARVAAADPTDPQSAKARAVQMLLDTYALCQARQRARGEHGSMADPDTRTMATIVATLAKLEGAAEPEKIDHFHKITVSADALATKLEALIASEAAVTSAIGSTDGPRAGDDSGDDRRGSKDSG